MNAGASTAQRFFAQYAKATVRIPKSAGNVYELFVFVLVCRAARKVGGSLGFHSITNGEFRFRTSPGWINNQWSYCSFPANGKNYEIRNGVQVLGHSGMHHESDITIFKAFAGTPGGQRDEIILSVECKEYADPARLKGEVRKNLGMVQDLAPTSHASRSGTHQRGCIHCGLDFKPLFVTNVAANQRPDIEDFVKAYELGPRFGVVPRSKAAGAFVKDTVRRIKARV